MGELAAGREAAVYSDRARAEITAAMLHGCGIDTSIGPSHSDGRLIAVFVLPEDLETARALVTAPVDATDDAVGVDDGALESPTSFDERAPTTDDWGLAPPPLDDDRSRRIRVAMTVVALVALAALLVIATHTM